MIDPADLLRQISLLRQVVPEDPLGRSTPVTGDAGGYELRRLAPGSISAVLEPVGRVSGGGPMPVDSTDLLRRLAARRAPAADLDPLGLTADEAALRADALRSSLPRAEMVLPGTPDTDPLGLAPSGAGADDPLGLALPADPGPRAPSPMSGSGFALNAPEQPLSASGRLTAQQATQRGQGPSGLERVANILEGLSAGATGRVPGFERRAAQAKQEARQAEADKLAKLKLLAEAADKAVETPELADFLGRIAQQVAGKDFDAEEWQTLTSGKGLALDAADFAEEMGDDYAGRFIQAVRPIRKDPAKVETVRKAFVADAKAQALDRLKPELLRRLRTPEVRAELLNAGDGTTLTEAAIVADLSGEGSGLKRFEREALTEWVQSDAGRAQLAQLGVTPASLTLKAAEAKAIDEAKAQNDPAKVSVPRLAAIAAGTVADPDISPEQAEAALARLQLQGADLPTLALRASQGDAKAEAALARYNTVAGQRAEATATGSLKGGGLPASTAKELAGLDVIDQMVGEVEVLLPMIESTLGPIAGRKAGILEATTNEGLTPAQVEARALVEDIADSLLRARSGAQINEQEYERLRKIVPTPNLPPEVFKSRLRRFQRTLRQTMAAKTKYATTPAGQLGAPPPPSPLAPGAPRREILGEPEEIE